MLRYAWLPLLAACTAAVPNGAPTESVSEAATECVVPRAIMSQPSPFFDALATWSMPDFERACALAQVSDEQQIEHPACAVIGYGYASGDGVAKDAGKAIDYLERAATCGFSFESQRLARVREQSIFGRSAGRCPNMHCARGCEIECEAASNHIANALEPTLERACAANHASACFMLASMVPDGEYVQEIGHVRLTTPRDRRALLEKACALGLGPACEYVAYEDRDAPDDVTARWLEKGCAAGWGYACLSRADLLPVGDRFPWWSKACALGLNRVCKDLAEIP